MKNLKRLAVLAMAGILTISQFDLSVFAKEMIDTEYVMDEEITVSDNSFDDDLVMADGEEDEGESVAINEDNFPDINFRQFLSKYDDNENTILEKDELKYITNINCHDVDIQSFEGIEFLKYLTNVDIKRVPASELDLSKNPSITRLIIQEMPISSIDFSNNKKLQYIEISECDIQSVYFGELENLTGINIEDCENFKELDVSGLSNLINLSVENDNLSNIDVSKNKKLSYLNINNNRIQEIDLSNNTELTYLRCAASENNRKVIIRELDLSNNKKLRELTCSYGLQGTSLDLSGCKDLITARLDECVLTGIDVTGCINLRYLDLTNDVIKTLDLSDNIYLEELFVPANGLKELDISNNLFLTYLDCSSNSIKELNIPKGSQLRTLICNYNYIERLDLSGCANLKTVICFNNAIKDINLDGACGLYSIDCRNNLIEELDISKTAISNRLNYGPRLRFDQNDIIMQLVLTKQQYEKLSDYNVFAKNNTNNVLIDDTYLDINKESVPDDNFREVILSELDLNNDGKISELEALMCDNLDLDEKGISSLKGIELLPNLYKLNCSDNDLTDVDLSKNTCLTDVDLSNNNISFIDVSACKMLRSLEIADNGLTKLDLSSNHNLEELNCSGNMLEDITFSDNMTVLGSVDVSKNKLKELTIIDSDYLMFLNCEDNYITELNLVGCDEIIELTFSYAFFRIKQKDDIQLSLNLSEKQYMIVKTRELMDKFKNVNVEWKIHEHVAKDDKWYYEGDNHYQKCKGCSEILGYEAHMSEKIQATESTCFENGIPEYYRCKCGYYEDEKCENLIVDLDAWKNENVKPLGEHKAEIISEVPSTCTEAGLSAYYKCICGYYEDQDCTKKIDDLDSWKKEHMLPLSDHAWSAGKVVQAATFYKEGTKEFTCANCLEKRTESIAKLDHLEVPVKGKTDVKAAALTVSGNKALSASSKMKFKVDNKKIATVSSKGVLKAKKTGTVKVSVFVRDENKKYIEACVITVDIKNTTVEKKVSVSSLSETVDLNKLVKDIPAGYSVKFELKGSNAKKAEIKDNILKPLKKGTITVKCTVYDESKYSVKKAVKVVVKIPKK